jgi:hypothetical protein
MTLTANPNMSSRKACLRAWRTGFAIAALLAPLLWVGSVAAQGEGWGWNPPRLTKIFDNGNIAAVRNGPRRPTAFTLDREATIVSVSTYHWNNGWGAWPGTVGLMSSSGRVYGPWQAAGSPGQGGVPNAYWTVRPRISLRPGTYTVLDSDPSTWAQNRGTRGAGMASVEGWYHWYAPPNGHGPGPWGWRPPAPR